MAKGKANMAKVKVKAKEKEKGIGGMMEKETDGIRRTKAKEKAEEEEKAEEKVRDGDHGAETRAEIRIDRGGRTLQTENETRRGYVITSETGWNARGERIASSLMMYRSLIRLDA